MSEPARQCGACNLCCKVMPIPELEKPAGVWCQHARRGQGCAIHGRHPASCQAFMCQWLLYPQIPEALKPDRAKVVLTAVRGSEAVQLVAYCDPTTPDAWRREPMHGFLRRQTGSAAKPRPVIVWAGKRMWLLTPDADHDLGEISGRQSFRIEPGPDGKPMVRLLDDPDAGAPDSEP